MQSVDIPSRARRVWEEICKDVNKAVVFTNAEEQLHWSAGTMMMIQAGAINIKPFSSFEVNNFVVYYQDRRLRMDDGVFGHLCTGLCEKPKAGSK